MGKCKEVLIDRAAPTHNQAYYYAIGRMDERALHVDVPPSTHADGILSGIAFADWYVTQDEGHALGFREGWKKWRKLTA